MAADITIDPFTTVVLTDTFANTGAQLNIVAFPTPVELVPGGSGGGGSTRPSTGMLYPRYS